MRELVRRSCNVMSKRYSKKVEVSSAPPLQIADYIKSIKTKQENFELKLEQGSVNFQHILENSRGQRVGQNSGGSEVSQRDQWRQDCVCEQEQFVVKAPQFSTEKCEGAMKQVKRYRRGFRQMMAGPDWKVAT